MASVSTGFAVFLGPEALPVHPSGDPATLGLLSLAGLDPAALAPPASAAVRLRLTQRTGWEGLNLPALLAAAEARPGAAIEIRPLPDDPAVATAVTGSAFDAARPPQWRLQWPGPPRPTTAFLDRDGTIIEDRHYLAEPEGVALLPGAAEGLRALAAMGMQLVVVTNQSGVAAKRIRPAELAAVNARMRSLLFAQGVQLDGIFACTHSPDAGCSCRKPGEGLVRQAAERLGVDLNRALVAGDKDSDIGLGRRIGAPTFLLRSGEGERTLESGAPPADYLVDDLRGVARICGHPAGLGTPIRLRDPEPRPDA